MRRSACWSISSAVMLAWQEEGQGLFDCLLDPAGQARIACRPLGEPGREIGLGFVEVAPVVEPPQFLKAVVAMLSGQRIEGVAQKVHVTALPGGLRKRLGDRRHEAGMIVLYHQFDAP